MQSRLFYVAPEAVHFVLTWDAETSLWSLRASEWARGQAGEVEPHPGDRYEFLTAEEAIQVLEAEARGRLGLL